MIALILACLIVGDSIAVDLGAEMRGRCSVDAQSGIGSAAIISRVKPSGLVVISSGSNDPRNPKLVSNLEASRVRAGASRVLWIVPQNPVAAVAVLSVAARYDDATVEFEAARDGIHPLRFWPLVRAVKRGLGEAK